MLNKLKQFIFKIMEDDWVIIDSASGFWNLTHSIGDSLPKKMCYFMILFSESRNSYELKVEGYRPLEHFLYGEMLYKVSCLNSGIPIDEGQEAVMIDDVEDKIVISKFSIKNKAAKVFKYAKKDEKLIEAINNIRKGLERRGVEIFDQKYNIIVTNESYLAAFWESDLRNPDGGINDLDTVK